MATFTWVADEGASQDRAPRILGAQFGDGYKQRALDGLNADMRTRALTFSGRTLVESAAIQAFLEAHGGVTAFDYTHAGDSSRKYICESWKVTDATGTMQNVSATFVQVPA